MVFLSLCPLRRYRIYNRCILLFKENIQIEKKLLNCDLKKAFVRIRFFLFIFYDVKYSVNLASAFNFIDAFWQMSSIGFMKFSLRSKFIPNNFSHKQFLCVNCLFLRWSKKKGLSSNPPQTVKRYRGGTPDVEVWIDWECMELVTVG